LPALRGVIRRRILVTFLVEPEVMQRQLPAPFRPKLLGDRAVAGLCLIRLEQMRPECLPLPTGLASENAAHRVAVCWDEGEGPEKEGVYIARRDTSSFLNALAGGRLFPGVAGRAVFRVRETEDAIDLAMRSVDGEVVLHLRARVAEALPESSRFGSLEAASAFYQQGAVGFSPANSRGVLEGMRLETDFWRVAPLAVETLYSSFFADPARFPAGTISFDSALLMREIPHRWETALPPLLRVQGCQGDASAPGGGSC
jgi:hypothetical protein